MNSPLYTRNFEKEFEFQTSRSSGPGGQHVNKTETRVELRFNVDQSELLSEEEKALIREKQGRRINQEGILQVFAQEYKSQKQNKDLVVKRFYHYLAESLKKTKKRVATKPSKKAKEKRLDLKKRQSEKKALRGKIDKHL